MNFREFLFHAVSILENGCGRTPRSGLTLFHAGQGCLASDSSAVSLGVVHSRPGPEQRRDLIGARL
jgi:hypothetical protein